METPLDVDEAFQNSWAKVLIRGKDDVVSTFWKVLQEPPGHGWEVMLSPLASLIVLDGFTDFDLKLHQSSIQLRGRVVWKPITFDVEFAIIITVSSTAMGGPEVLQFQISPQSGDGLVKTRFG